MKLNAYRYKIPFVAPLENNQQTFSHRHGLLLEFKSASHTFYGEAAPLPGFSKETLKEVIETYRRLEKKITGILKAENAIKLLKKFYRKQRVPPSLAFAIDTLIYKIAGHRKGKNLREYLFSDAPNKVFVNALVSLSSKNLINEVQKYTEEGFETIKFKIGMNFEAEYQRLRKIRTEFPDLTLRLDANKAWSLNEALQNCRKLTGLDIEYCEEPLQDASPQNFEKLVQNTELSLAIDESLIRTSRWEDLLPFTSHIIIKPMLLGSFAKLFETQQLANTLDNEIIFTTSLESGIGRRTTAILASGLGSARAAHGLATGKHLAKDFHRDKNCIINGKFELNNVQNDSINNVQDIKPLQ